MSRPLFAAMLATFIASLIGVHHLARAIAENVGIWPLLLFIAGCYGLARWLEPQSRTGIEP